MTKKYALFFLIALTCLFVVPSLAQVASPTAAPVVSASPAISLDTQVATAASDFLAGKLAMGFACVILIVTYLFRTYLLPKLSLSSAILPWVSVVLGVVFSVATAVSGGTTVEVAIKAAILSGPLASSLWSMILKNIIHTSS